MPSKPSSNEASCRIGLVMVLAVVALFLAGCSRGGGGGEGRGQRTPGPLKATAIAAGPRHTCAVLLDRRVACWGLNDQGQLGTTKHVGTNSPNAFPIVVSGLSAVLAVSAGQHHTCARLSDSTVKCRGDNTSGKLGNGTVTSSAIPVTVSGP